MVIFCALLAQRIVAEEKPVEGYFKEANEFMAGGLDSGLTIDDGSYHGFQ